MGGRKKVRMAILKVVTPPNKTLREQAKKVRGFGPDTQSLIDNMIETMRASNGVGLAAPQVDVGKRIIVIEYAENDEDEDAPEKPPTLYEVLNPEIVRHSPHVVNGTEACLSLPGYYGDVERYETVTVKGLNRQGKPFKKKARGWLARIFQHEIDHLDGILYIDRASQMWEAGSGDVPDLV